MTSSWQLIRVLVVEDNHEVRRMVTASIKTLGAEIEVLDVPSAEEALFISASLPLDLVVFDIRLPGMSGLEMVARLRKRKPETKIILVTGVDDVADPPAGIRSRRGRLLLQAHRDHYFPGCGKALFVVCTRVQSNPPSTVKDQARHHHPPTM